MQVRTAQTSHPRLSWYSRPLGMAVLTAALLLTGRNLPAQDYYARVNANMVQRVADAYEQLRIANANLNELTEQTKSHLIATDPKWAALRQTVDDSRQRCQTLKPRILQRMRASAQYLSAQRAMAEAEEQLRRLTDAQDTLGKPFEQAANTILDTQAMLRQMELSALAASPELRMAEADRIRAESELAAQWYSYVSTTLTHNPSWNAALTARNNAERAVKAAERDLGV